MAQDLVAVRMLCTIDQCRVVLELLQGAEYVLPAEKAQQLIDAGAAEAAASNTPRLEAAALSAARRRG